MVKFEVTGDDGTLSDTLLNPDEAKDMNTSSFTLMFLRVTAPVSGKFSLKYLTHFTKATVLSECVVVSMNQDEPIVMEYKIDPMGSLTFHLAAKLD